MQAKQFEQVRNIANGIDKNKGRDKFDSVMKDLEEEESLETNKKPKMNETPRTT